VNRLKILLIGRLSLDIFEEHHFKKSGGTIFNIAKILAETSNNELVLIAPIANDENSKIIRQDLKKLKIKLIEVSIGNTPVEVYKDHSKHLDVFDLEKLVSVQSLANYADELLGFDAIVGDLHFLQVINFVSKLNPEARFFVDATSQNVVKRIEGLKLTNAIVKFNRKQASVLTDHVIFDTIDCHEVMEIMKKKGVNRAVITLDKDGCFYFDENHHGLLKAEVLTNKKYYDAGDAFHAGFILGGSIAYDIAFMAKTGIETSAKQIRKEIDLNFLKTLKSDI
jgi:sugar/nucleoside kinase (ribokinase family)